MQARSCLPSCLFALVALPGVADAQEGAPAVFVEAVATPVIESPSMLSVLRQRAPRVEQAQILDELLASTGLNEAEYPEVLLRRMETAISLALAPQKAATKAQSVAAAQLKVAMAIGRRFVSEPHLSKFKRRDLALALFAELAADVGDLTQARAVIVTSLKDHPNSQHIGSAYLLLAKAAQNPSDRIEAYKRIIGRGHAGQFAALELAKLYAAGAEITIALEVLAPLLVAGDEDSATTKFRIAAQQLAVQIVMEHRQHKSLATAAALSGLAKKLATAWPVVARQVAEQLLRKEEQSLALKWFESVPVRQRICNWYVNRALIGEAATKPELHEKFAIEFDQYFAQAESASSSLACLSFASKRHFALATELMTRAVTPAQREAALTVLDNHAANFPRSEHAAAAALAAAKLSLQLAFISKGTRAATLLLATERRLELCVGDGGVQSANDADEKTRKECKRLRSQLQFATAAMGQSGSLPPAQ